MASNQDFTKAMKGLDRKVRNTLIKDSMKVALKPLAAKIKQDAPVETGELEAGIKVRVGPRKKDNIVMSVYISTHDDNPHAARVELGTREKPPEPFIRPNAKGMTQQIMDDFKDGIDRGLNAL